ncbi:MAG: asparagine synthase-related protein [Methylococcales bacterium]
MSFLAGWADTDVNPQSSKQVCSKIAATVPQQLDANLTTYPAEFAVCIASEHKSLQESAQLLAVTGCFHIEKQQLADMIADYQQRGDDFVTRINQPLTLVLIDQAKRRLLLATDRLGQRNLYYAQTKNGLVFGSTADSVIAHPEVNADISEQSIYDYVYFHHCPSPNTIYKQVKKLEGGQILSYQDGKITIRTYWTPDFYEKMHRSVAQAGQELQQKIQQSVQQLAVGAGETGAFLSGGLDSSSVVGALAQVYPDAAKTFTMGFPVEGYDEIDYARIAVQHFHTQAHEYYLTPDDTVAAIPDIAAYYDEPFGNSSALAAYYCAKMAKENGIKLLLAGDGGDELFAGNERYARQLLFDGYQKIPAPLRKTTSAIFQGLPEALLQNKLLFKAKRYIDQANIPLPDRLQDYNFLHRHAVQEIFNADFISHIDSKQPLQGLRDCYHRPEQASTLNRMLYMDWKSTLHDNDLVKVNKMCEMAGVDVCYPLLSQEIVDFSCRIPSDLKLKGQQLRWFYKQAMTDFLPEQIINKSKHGFGLPFGIWLKDHQPLMQLAYDSINDLKRRHYFRPEFLDHAITMHQSIHASYYGELIWILMMLELWLQGKKL